MRSSKYFILTGLTCFIRNEYRFPRECITSQICLGHRTLEEVSLNESPIALLAGFTDPSGLCAACQEILTLDFREVIGLKGCRVKIFLRDLFQIVKFKVAYRFTGAESTAQKTVILFFNRMWGGAFDFAGLELPPGVMLTSDRRWFRQATAVVFHVPDMRWLSLVRKIPGQIWVAWSLESEAHYPQLCDPEFMKQFDLTMTYHRDADIVSSYFDCYGSPENFKLHLLTPTKPKSGDKLANLFISSPHDKSGRSSYLRELVKHLSVHSYGKFMQTHILQDDRGRQSKLDIIAGYKFTLAFENARTTDYVTEKFYDPLVAGSVPVYLGAPNVHDFAPGEHCFINVDDFASPRALAEYLLSLHVDDAAYKAYFSWKQRPLRPEFCTMLEGQRESRFVRLCRKVLAKGKSEPPR